jgi:hypothetical protein
MLLHTALNLELNSGLHRVSTDLPQMLSDEEFAKLLKAREGAARPEHDCWDNAGVRPPPEIGDGLPESCIEQQFPHIAKKLTLAWPSEACALYIADLVVNTREARQGFPKEVVEDLLMLHAINDMLMRVGTRGQRASTQSAAYSRTPLRWPR